MNILLTGASGTVGTEVLKILTLSRENNIFVFDVKSKRNREFFEPYLKYIQLISGNLTRTSDINEIPAHMDVVIHLAAIIPPAADKNPTQTLNINVEGTRQLVHHLEITSPDAFLMYSSSIAVYGDRMENPYITVNDELQPGENDIYGQSKILAEQIIRESKLNWTIFRLAAIMKNHKISKLMFHMPLDTKLEICTPEDTAMAFVLGIDKREQLNHQIFNLGGGVHNQTSYRTFLKRSFQQFGLGRLNFPNKTFAEQNFHCGFLADGDKLEEILHFRRDTLEIYFYKTKLRIKPIVHFAGVLFRPLIKFSLLMSSEPYRAKVTRNKKMSLHFFGNKTQIKHHK